MLKNITNMQIQYFLQIVQNLNFSHIIFVLKLVKTNFVKTISYIWFDFFFFLTILPKCKDVHCYACVHRQYKNILALKRKLMDINGLYVLIYVNIGG